MKIFVTGGTGNIGQYVTTTLLDAGHSVVLLTRTPERIPAYLALENVEVKQGNLLDYAGMGEALKGCDAVIHIALGWGNTPVEMLENDTRATAYLAEAAEKNGVAKFVYTSSTAAMGDLRDGMDETALRMPGDLYGATKASAEHFLLGFNQNYTGQGAYGGKVKLKRNIIRPGYVFSNPAFEGGASQSDTRFLNLAKDLLQSKDVEFSKFNGTQFLSGAQIAQLYLKLVESDLNREIFMALGSKFVSWADIANLMLQEIPESTSKVVVPDAEDPGKPSYYCADKMRRVFGLSFEGDEDLPAHCKWNVERARKILAGEDVHNPYHVW
ncbi:MAG: NAD(P)-dependent oxidoreductase [Clostridiales bacterium]|jgi:UDP-glucose 4-epimerase|nr:NAD(P)-dependent oxidoreductase [Clostridiales bacterium]